MGIDFTGLVGFLEFAKPQIAEKIIVAWRLRAREAISVSSAEAISRRTESDTKFFSL